MYDNDIVAGGATKISEFTEFSIQQNLIDYFSENTVGIRNFINFFYDIRTLELSLEQLSDIFRAVGYNVERKTLAFDKNFTVNLYSLSLIDASFNDGEVQILQTIDNQYIYSQSITNTMPRKLVEILAETSDIKEKKLIIIENSFFDISDIRTEICFWQFNDGRWITSKNKYSYMTSDEIIKSDFYDDGISLGYIKFTDLYKIGYKLCLYDKVYIVDKNKFLLTNKLEEELAFTFWLE